MEENNEEGPAEAGQQPYANVAVAMEYFWGLTRERSDEEMEKLVHALSSDVDGDRLAQVQQCTQLPLHTRLPLLESFFADCELCFNAFDRSVAQQLLRSLKGIVSSTCFGLVAAVLSLERVEVDDGVGFVSFDAWAMADCCVCFVGPDLTVAMAVVRRMVNVPRVLNYLNKLKPLSPLMYVASMMIEGGQLEYYLGPLKRNVFALTQTVANLTNVSPIDVDDVHVLRFLCLAYELLNAFNKSRPPKDHFTLSFADDFAMDDRRLYSCIFNSFSPFECCHKVLELFLSDAAFIDVGGHCLNAMDCHRMSLSTNYVDQQRVIQSAPKMRRMMHKEALAGIVLLVTLPLVSFCVSQFALNQSV